MKRPVFIWEIPLWAKMKGRNVNREKYAMLLNTTIVQRRSRVRRCSASSPMICFKGAGFHVSGLNCVSLNTEK